MEDRQYHNEGYTVLELIIEQESVFTPFLVTKQSVRHPIIGTNVMSALLNSESKDRIMDKLTSKGIDGTAVINMIDAIKSDDETDNYISWVKIGAKDVVLKPGETRMLSCNLTNSITVNEDAVVLFESQDEELSPSAILV